MDENQLQSKIETMLKDTVKGLATKEELRKEIAETSAKYFQEQQAESKTQLESANKKLKETETTVTDLVSQVKLLRATRMSSIKDSDGNYRGVWGSSEMAKNFGLYVMSDVLGIPQAKKAFEATGIERRMMVGNQVIEGKALGSSDPTAGAALAPSEFVPRLVELIEAYSAYRQVAQEQPLGAGDASVPVITSDITVYCPGAGVTATASTLGTKTLGLNPLEWVAYTAVNNDLDEDAAIPVGELVARSLARSFGNKEDACGFVGDGTKAYFNVIGARAALRAVDATVTNVKGLHVQDTPGAWSAIDLQDLLAVAALLPEYAEIDMGNEVNWMCSKAFYVTVMLNAAFAAGGAYAAEVLKSDVFTKPTFLGRPVKFAGGMPKVKESADHCPLLYGNGRQGLMLGDRRKLTIAQSREVLFLNRQTAIMGTERIAINNHGVGDTTNAGPIVGLWADIA